MSREEAALAAKDAEIARLRKALEPFAVIGRAIRLAARSEAWLEHPLFYAGTDDDPQSMTLTGRAFDNAARAAALKGEEGK